MDPSTISKMQDLAFLWQSFRIRDNTCCSGLVHDNYQHCLLEFFQKMVDSGRVGSKYYIIFHFFPFLLGLRKVKKWQQVKKLLLQTTKNYAKSVCFISLLVGLLRHAFCLTGLVYKKTIYPINFLPITGAPLSAISILFEPKSRRGEITSFVCSKALRSFYMIFKRMYRLPVKGEAEFMHIVSMACLYYLYNHQGELIKFRNLFRYIFGQTD